MQFNLHALHADIFLSTTLKSYRYIGITFWYQLCNLICEYCSCVRGFISTMRSDSETKESSDLETSVFYSEYLSNSYLVLFSIFRPPYIFMFVVIHLFCFGSSALECWHIVLNDVLHSKPHSTGHVYVTWSYWNSVDQTKKGGSKILNFFPTRKSVKSDYGVVWFSNHASPS